MNLFNNLTDALFTYDQDISYDNGDIKITSGIDLFKRKVYKLLTSEPGDWKLHRNIGSSPEKFIGEPNTRVTANAITKWFIDKLQPFITPSTVDIKVVPIDIDSVKLYIDINLISYNVISLTMKFDYINGISYIDFDETEDELISSVNTKLDDSTSLHHPNPFWSKMK